MPTLKPLYNDGDIYDLLKKHHMGYVTLRDKTILNGIEATDAANALKEMRKKYENNRQPNYSHISPQIVADIYDLTLLLQSAADNGFIFKEDAKALARIKSWLDKQEEPDYDDDQDK